MAVYAMSVIGWRVCWEQRYRPLVSHQGEASETDESSELNGLQTNHPPINENTQSFRDDYANKIETDTAAPKVV